MNRVLKYDVIVIGGGPAGAVAAIAAARRGAKTLLVERYGYLGGMLTTAGVGPMMTFHAGDTQVIRGIPDEIVSRMVKMGFSPGHMEDFVGYASSVTPFDAEGLKLVLETMAVEAGVQLLYHTVYTGCKTENNRITKVNLFAKGGFFQAEAKVFVDCSADADLATDAGVSSVYGRESDQLAQPMTMNIRVSNVDTKQLIQFIKEHPQDVYETTPIDRLEVIPRTGLQGAYSLIQKAKDDGTFPIDRNMVLCFETNHPGEMIINMSRVVKHCAVDPFSLTDAELQGRHQAQVIVAFLRQHIPGFADCRLISTGPHIGIRESRKINGVYKLTAEDLLSCTMFDDAIAMGGYPVDIHSPDGQAMVHKHLLPGSWYSIPYRSLIVQEIDNLIVAGRCISATHEACAAIRVTPIVMAVGQAAGTAAAQSVQTGECLNCLSTKTLQEALVCDNAFLMPYQKADNS